MATLRYEEVPIHKVIDKLKKLPLSQKLSDDDFALIISSLREPIENHLYKVYYCDVCGTMHVIYRYLLNYNIVAALYLLYLSGGVLETVNLEEAFDNYYDQIPRHSIMFMSLEEKGNYKKIYKLITAKMSRLVDFGLAEYSKADFINEKGKKVQNNCYKITKFGKDFFEGKAMAPMAIGYTDGEVFDKPRNEDKLVSIYDVLHCRYTQLSKDTTEKDEAENMLKNVNKPYIFIDDEDTPKSCDDYVYEKLLEVILDHMIYDCPYISYEYLQSELNKIKSNITDVDTLIHGLSKHFNLRFGKYKHIDNKIYYYLLSKTIENRSPFMEENELINNLQSINKRRWNNSYREVTYNKDKNSFSYKYFGGDYYTVYGNTLANITKELKEKYYLYSYKIHIIK